ncbi:glycoside hydrolase [Myxozyma melibiosi]|uniref:alpha-1,2-Mannosidase n=1 Tax=Myxozyma melibiosi TaxID=54550 RepID=A0ABR1F9P2_9ASCO
MSFNLPQNVPDFSTQVRKAEDSVWTRATGSSAALRGGRRLPSSDLPMYKDKPQRRAGKGSRWTGVIFLFGVLVVMFIFVTSASDSDETEEGGSWSLFGGSKSSGALSSKAKQALIKEAFVESWDDYAKHALGKDIYHPISKKSRNMAPEGLGWIVVDCLDTMMLMNLEEPLKTARSWVEHNLTYDQDYAVNTFETTIRMLGGLLSAHYMSNYDDLYLEKAVDLANRLIGAFESHSGVPYASVNLHTSVGVSSHDDMGASSTAEVASLQLEFKYVAKLTGEALYWEKAEQVMKVIDENHARDGLVPIFIRPDTGKFQGANIRLGSRGDSYYEYLLKQYLQTYNKETAYRKMYDEAMTGVKKRLVQKSKPNGFTFVAELDHGWDNPTLPKMDHLVCFLPGNLALGSTNGLPLKMAQRTSWTAQQASDLKLAKELMRTCYEMYAVTKTGIAPEIAFFNTDDSSTTDITIKWQDSHNLQRPETVESLFIMWRITKDPIYREWGWNIFEAFRKYERVLDGNGYCSLESVNEIPPRFRDNMESFWLAETLKYLYLLFEDDDTVLPLDKVVFNTEAHPFPKFKMEPLFKTGWERTEKSAEEVKRSVEEAIFEKKEELKIPEDPKASEGGSEGEGESENVV